MVVAFSLPFFADSKFLSRPGTRARVVPQPNGAPARLPAPQLAPMATRAAPNRHVPLNPRIERKLRLESRSRWTAGMEDHPESATWAVPARSERASGCPNGDSISFPVCSYRNRPAGIWGNSEGKERARQQSCSRWASQARARPARAPNKNSPPDRNSLAGRVLYRVWTRWWLTRIST